MKPQNVILSLLFILLLSGIFLCRKWQEPSQKEAFNRDPDQLHFNRLAVCQMDCQQIGKNEVKLILKKGIILLNKSNRFQRPCPTFAVQGPITGGKSLRVIFEQCAKETNVLACYVLKPDYKCQCPVDTIKVN